jgi:hypothetical protein
MSSSSNRRIKKKAKRKKQSALKKKQMTREKVKRIAKEKRAREYPIFHYEDYNREAVSEKFVREIKQTLSGINFDDQTIFKKEHMAFFKLMKKIGFKQAIDLTKRGISDSRKKDLIKVSFEFFVGQIVFQKLREKGILDDFIPYNDVGIYPSGNDFIVKFDGLLSKRTKYGTIYYSSLKPKVKIEGNEFIVAFTRHAIERICDRCVADWRMYAGAGDVFSYIKKCNFFEVIKPSDSSKKNFITFYDGCTEGFFNFNYVTEVLGSYEPNKNYFYRVGYCPVGISGEFVSAITMLTPGMRGTPEHLLLINSNLPTPKKDEFKRYIEISMKKIEFANDSNFEAIKWFHQNGIPQVVKMETDPYTHS